MSDNYWNEDAMLEVAMEHYFSDNGEDAMQPAGHSTATYCPVNKAWLIELVNVNGTLAEYWGFVDPDGSVRFEDPS